MERFIFFVEQIANGLYILCGLGILLGLRSYFAARRMLQGAQFELEKELARFRVNNASTAVLVFLELGLAVFATAQVVAPTLRANPPKFTSAIAEVVETPFLTAAPGALNSGTPVPSFAEGVPIPGLEDELNLQPFATPTLTPTPVGTIIPDAPPVEGCDTDEANLRIPANGMVVFEATDVVGTANTTDFAFYRFEIKGPETRNNWSMFREYTSPVIDGELGNIVPSQLIPGEYKFRLTVYDITNTMRASCMITIIISPPIPTATPIRAS
jgi:hypothetical protein